MSRFVLISPNGDFERLVRLAVTGLHGSLHVFPVDYLPEGPADILRQMQGEPPEVLILGPGLPVEGSLKLASVMDLQYPEISVVLAAAAAPETVLQAMRAGVRDFLDPAADADTIRIMLERASLAAAGRRRGLAPQTSEHADHGGAGHDDVMRPAVGIVDGEVAAPALAIVVAADG